MTKSYSHQKEIRAIIQKACDDRGLLILLTQYLKFESSFILLDGDEVHARTTAGGEEALRILGVSELGLRFPSGADFLGASTRMIGLSSVEGVRTVKFALPALLQVSDSRKAPRTGLTEGAFATFALRGKRMIRAGIANISVSGLRLRLAEDVPSAELRVRDKLTLSITLPGDISILNGASVRNMDYRNVGVEFDPPLSGADMAALSKWVFTKKEEELELEAKREDNATGPGPRRHGPKGGAAGNALLLVTGDEGLKLDICNLLGEGRNVLCVPPTPVSVSYGISQKPLMVILHASGRDEAGWQFLKTLPELVPRDTPVLLLGTDVEADALSDLGRECRALASMQMAPNKAQFLQRLVVGILRKYYGGGESPLAM